MIDTLEARWFVTGRPPSSVVDWMQTIGAQPESARTDLYLLSDDPAVNVKLREGQVQTKHRMGERTRVQFCNTVSGIQERWVKWCFPTVEQHHDLFDDDPTGLWVPVHKERMQREIEPDEQNQLFDHLIEADPAVGKVELTEVRSGDHEAWTICVEAEGRPEALPGTIQQIGNYLFDQGSPPDLSRDHSFGYTYWLQSVETPPVERRAAPSISA